MSAASIATAFVLVGAYTAFALPTMLRFRAYCARVAKLTGREKDLADPFQADDAGTTRFEREQLDALDDGSYKKLPDAELVRLGDVLASKMLWMRGLAVAVVVAVVCVVSWMP